MYAERITAVHEPRYFMPALPAIALLAGVAIDKIAFIGTNKKNNSASKPNSPNITGGIFVILVVFSLVFVSVVPAENHFQQIRDGDYTSLKPRNPPGPDQPKDQPILVVTDQLLKEPERFLDKAIVIKRANISRIEQQVETLWIRSPGSIELDSIEVRLRDWPTEELDRFETGQLVDVLGFFRKASSADPVPKYFISVKYGTNDFIQIVE